MQRMAELKSRRWRYGEQMGIGPAGNDEVFEMRRMG